MKVLLLSRADVEGLISIREAIEAVEGAFRAKGLDKVQMPPKSYVYFDRYEGDFRVMPAYLEEQDAAGVKIVNAHPRNPKEHSLPAVMAIIVLLDPKTGVPLAIMDGTWVTNIRTGAGGAVAVKYLARKDSRIVAMVGAGVQARTQLAALNEVLTVEEVRVNDSVAEKAERYAEEMSKKLGISVKAVKDMRRAVEGADVVVTTTPVRVPIVKNEWISPGTHINAIGADACYTLDTEIMTPNGFIPVGELKEGMMVWSVNPTTRILEKAKVTKMHVYKHEGEIINVENLYTSFSITSNHNVPNFSRDGKRFISFVRASELGSRWQTVTTVKVEWNGEDREFFILPKIEKTNNRQKEYRFRVTDWMEFLGWYISEGSLHRSNYGIEIFQRDERKKEKIRKLLLRMGLKTTEIKDGLSFGSKQIFAYLRDHVGAKNTEKRIPVEFLELNKKYLSCLLNSLIEGDGWKRKTKGGKERYCYSTTSKALMDNLIELAIKLGRFCTVYNNGKGRMVNGKDGERTIHAANPVYTMGIGAEGGYVTRSVYKREIKYCKRNCIVACPQLDKNHILIIRRNGKITMNGNSGKQELDPQILARAKIVVDDVEQAIHGGEVNVPFSRGIITRGDISADIGEVITGKKPGRTSREEITVFDSTGLAVQDIATDWVVYKKAREAGKGIEVELL